MHTENVCQVYGKICFAVEQQVREGLKAAQADRGNIARVTWRLMLS